MTILRFFSRRHLGFSKGGDIRGGKGQDGQNASPCQILRRSVKPLLRYGDFSTFQDGGRRHLAFSKSWDFRGGKARMRNRAKFCSISQALIIIRFVKRQNVKRLPWRWRTGTKNAAILLRYGHFSISAILDFQNIGILGVRRVQTPKIRSMSQISSRSVTPFVRYGDFSIFRGGGRRHLGFSKDGNFRGVKGREGQNASPCQILRRSVKPLLTYGHFPIFQDAAAILDFHNLEILVAGRVKTAKMRHPAKFRVDRSNRC